MWDAGANTFGTRFWVFLARRNAGVAMPFSILGTSFAFSAVLFVLAPPLVQKPRYGLF